MVKDSFLVLSLSSRVIVSVPCLGRGLLTNDEEYTRTFSSLSHVVALLQIVEGKKVDLVHAHMEELQLGISDLNPWAVG